MSTVRPMINTCRFLFHSFFHSCQGTRLMFPSYRLLNDLEQFSVTQGDTSTSCTSTVPEYIKLYLGHSRFTQAFFTRAVNITLHCAPSFLSHALQPSCTSPPGARGRESSRRHAGCDVDVKVSWRDTATDIEAFLLVIDLLFTKHKRAARRGGLTVASRPPSLPPSLSSHTIASSAGCLRHTQTHTPARAIHSYSARHRCKPHLNKIWRKLHYPCYVTGSPVCHVSVSPLSFHVIRPTSLSHTTKPTNSTKEIAFRLRR